MARDPDFEGGMRRVLIVYQDVALQNARRAAGETASNIITVSVDEKPGVQAIGNTAPDLPPVPDKHPTISRDHEYERLGTCSILAALDLQDGHVTARVEDRPAVSNSLACCSTSMRSIRLNAPSESYWIIIPLTFLKRRTHCYRATPTASSTSSRRNVAHG